MTLRADEDLLFFESNIRPALVEHCYPCHSSEASEIGGNLNLETRDSLLKGGESGPAIVPGDADASLLLQAIRYDGMEMPPEGRLPDQIIHDFDRWIKAGAKDPRTETPDHRSDESTELKDKLPWSFTPINRPSLPQVSNQDWPQNAIDRFVLARLESAHLNPTHDAAPSTLIRRLYYDLIGLPPKEVDVEAFESKYALDSQAAIQALVDTLLTSPEFGVRWGRHWLDVARYGESNGDDGLGRNASFPHAWRYRDYVIDSFNRSVPYDQFLREQIAGDLLPTNTADERNRNLTATGFLAIGSKPAVAMNDNFAMDVVDDQINVVSTGIMGLSVACARCHDHKHDPIPTRDYYALAGIFSSTETLYGAAGNEPLTAPPTPLHELRSELQKQYPTPDRSAPPNFSETYFQTLRNLRPSLIATLTEPHLALTSEPSPSYSIDGFAKCKETMLRGSLTNPTPNYSVSLWFKNDIANDARPITTYLFSYAKTGDTTLPGDHLGIGGNYEREKSGKLFVFNGNNAKESLAGTTIIPPQTWNHVVLVREKDQVTVFLNGQLEIEGELPSTFGDSTEFSFGCRSDRFAPLEGNLGSIALFSRALTAQNVSSIHSASGQPLGIRTLPPEGFAMGVRDKATLVNCKIHINGEGRKLGPEVPRGFLSAHANNAPLTNSQIPSTTSGRLELVEWLLHPEHPQTSRVLANRIWLKLFGRGIVTTPDDFGSYGAPPSHPELLDYLATRLIESGWSMKHLIREIVLSRTYQLDSRCDLTLIQADPENELIGRHSRRRLDAEAIRDSILMASGELDLSPGTGSAIDSMDLLINWPPGESSNLHKESQHRSIYLCMLRHAPPSELAAFDLPDGVSIEGQRESTVLSTHGLFLLNNSFVVEQSRVLANRLMGDNSLSITNRIHEACSSILHRLPTDEETNRALRFLEDTEKSLMDHCPSLDERERLALASLCQALFASNEFRYID